MSPLEFLTNALHAAFDNALDMGMPTMWACSEGEAIAAHQYAISEIVGEVCSGSTDLLDSGYFEVHEREVQARFSGADLQPYLSQALTSFLQETGA